MKPQSCGLLLPEARAALMHAIVQKWPPAICKAAIKTLLILC